MLIKSPGKTSTNADQPTAGAKLVIGCRRRTTTTGYPVSAAQPIVKTMLPTALPRLWITYAKITMMANTTVWLDYVSYKYKCNPSKNYWSFFDNGIFSLHNFRQIVSIMENNGTEFYETMRTSLNGKYKAFKTIVFSGLSSRFRNFLPTQFWECKNRSFTVCKCNKFKPTFII